MLRSFIDANAGKRVRLYTPECHDQLCSAPEGVDEHYVVGLFMGLRYDKRFRCIGIAADLPSVPGAPASTRTTLVRLKDVLRVEPLDAEPDREESDGRRRTEEGTYPGSL